MIPPPAADDWYQFGGLIVTLPFSSNIRLSTMTKFTLCILLLVLCATVPNVAVSARRVISTTSLSSLTISNSLRRRGDALKNPSFDDKHTLISEEVVKDVRGGQGGGTATMSSEMFNMVKAVVGVGVLSLPAGKKFSITLTPPTLSLFISHFFFLIW